MIVPPRGQKDPGPLVDCLSALAQGSSNAIGLAPVVLSPGATETEVTDRLCAPASLVFLCLDSATAAAAQPYLKQAGAGSFVLGHLPAGADAKLRYEIRRP